jgi:hypothetical protein
VNVTAAKILLISKGIGAPPTGPPATRQIRATTSCRAAHRAPPAEIAVASLGFRIDVYNQTGGSAAVAISQLPAAAGAAP